MRERERENEIRRKSWGKDYVRSLEIGETDTCALMSASRAFFFFFIVFPVMRQTGLNLIAIT